MPFSLLLLALMSQIRPSRQQIGPIICYDYNGTPYPNNTQCEGSSVCCNTADLCTPQRLCSFRGQLIRPTCSQDPWNESCSPLCHYEDSDPLLPRLSICSDGSFCCDRDQGCCKNKRGVFLDDSGQIISSSSSIPASTSTSAADATTAELSATASAAPSAAPPSSSALSSGAVAGISIAAVLAFLGIIAALVLCYRRRRGRSRALAPPPKDAQFDGRIGELEVSSSPKKIANSFPVELPNGTQWPHPEARRPAELNG